MDDNQPESAKRRQSDDTAWTAWIERVVSVAGHLGFNTMRVRWKLIRFQNEWRRRANLRQQRIAHITYAHKTCATCGAIQDRAEAVCTRCGEKLGHRGFQVAQRLGLAMPVALSTSTVLAIAFLCVYARVWQAAGGGLAAPSVHLLVDFGGRLPTLVADEPWRLVTATFLHAGILHLGFNILALATVGPRVEEIYGRATMLAVFVITGALANLAVLPLGHVAVGIGASGGVMGLFGAAAGYGHRTGTSYGRALRNTMLQWMAYTFIAGFALGADNGAHLFGALIGVGFGLVVRPTAWMRPSWAPLRAALGVVGIIGIVGALAIIMTRTPSARPTVAEAKAKAKDRWADAHDMMADHVAACIKLYAGDTAGAVAAARRMVIDPRPRAEVADDDVLARLTLMCDTLQRMRDSCTSGDTTHPPETDPDQREGCEFYKATLNALPVHASPGRP